MPLTRELDPTAGPLDFFGAEVRRWRTAAIRPVSARIERQAIFTRPDPPLLWAVLDEGVLRRRIGDAKVMHDQLMHLLVVSERSKITIQVVPADAGAHVGLLGAFALASFKDAPGIVYLESPDQGQTTERPAAVAKATEIFDKVRAEAMPRGASLNLIRKVAEQQWTT